MNKKLLLFATLFSVFSGQFVEAGKKNKKKPKTSTQHPSGRGGSAGPQPGSAAYVAAALLAGGGGASASSGVNLNNSKIEDLIKAAQSGNVKAVKVLLREGVNVNAKDSRGWTALMVASQEGHVEIVKLLVEHGNIDVTAKNIGGSTACALAIANKHVEIVKLFLLPPFIKREIENEINRQFSSGGGGGAAEAGVASQSKKFGFRGMFNKNKNKKPVAKNQALTGGGSGGGGAEPARQISAADAAALLADDRDASASSQAYSDNLIIPMEIINDTSSRPIVPLKLIVFDADNKRFVKSISLTAAENYSYAYDLNIANSFPQIKEIRIEKCFFYVGDDDLKDLTSNRIMKVDMFQKLLVKIFNDKEGACVCLDVENIAIKRTHPVGTAMHVFSKKHTASNTSGGGGGGGGAEPARQISAAEAAATIKTLQDNFRKAIKRNDHEAIKNSCVALQQNGYDINTFVINPPHPATALLYAAGKGKLRAVRYLLEECDANIMQVDQVSRNILHYAAAWGDDAVSIESLILDIIIPKYKSCLSLLIDAQDAEGNTPLHFAKNAYNAIVLKDAEARTDVKNNKGRLPKFVKKIQQVKLVAMVLQQNRNSK